MSSFKIDLTGIPELLKKLTEIPKNAEKQVYAEFTATGTDIVRDAKALAPVDEGHLKSSISFQVTKGVKGPELEIIVATDYAAYVEFGTRSFAAAYVSSLPPDWQTFAATFKGPGGGSFAELVDRLTRWVRLKGISGEYQYVTQKPKRIGASGKGPQFATGKARNEAEDYNTAYLIALSILKKGIKAHPFLYPAVNYHKDILIKNLKEILAAK